VDGNFFPCSWFIVENSAHVTGFELEETMLKIGGVNFSSICTFSGWSIVLALLNNNLKKQLQQCTYTV